MLGAEAIKLTLFFMVPLSTEFFWNWNSL